MKTIGITAEYNPFHNGHAYQIRKARELTGADCVIAVMSGDFTQRGEPAVMDKWDRAKAAVSAEDGPDLVVELPFAFACSKADVFARGAVDMLVLLGADCISFGCEAEDPAVLTELAQTLVISNDEIAGDREAFMKEGHSAAKAYSMAVAQHAGFKAAELLLEPNNILALEYLKRILYWRSRGREIEELPIRRYGSGYDEVSTENPGYAGGSALRKMIREGADVSRYMPGTCAFENMEAVAERYLMLLKGAVLRSTAREIRSNRGVGEGLENSIRREIKTAADTDGIVSALTSRRYTGATIRRALTHILTGTGWDEADALTQKSPSAGRLLAAGRTGRTFIREVADEGLTIVTNLNKEEQELKPEDRKLLSLDEKAADIYNLLCGRDLYLFSDRMMNPYIE